MRLLGFAYEADFHCIECTCKHFNLTEKDIQENGNLKDSDGNFLYALYSFIFDGKEYFCTDCFKKLKS